MNDSKSNQAHNVRLVLEELLPLDGTGYTSYVFGSCDCSPERIPEEVLRDMFPLPRLNGNNDSDSKKLNVQYPNTVPVVPYLKE